MTNEEIAEQMITVKNGRGDWPEVKVDGALFCACSSEKTANKRAVRLKKAVLPLLQRAREEGSRDALSHNLPDAPMTDEEVVQAIEDFLAVPPKDPRRNQIRALGMVNSLLSQVRWLEQCLRDAGNDSWGDGYRAGYAAREREAEEVAAENWKE